MGNPVVTVHSDTSTHDVSEQGGVYPQGLLIRESNVTTTTPAQHHHTDADTREKTPLT